MGLRAPLKTILACCVLKKQLTQTVRAEMLASPLINISAAIDASAARIVAADRQSRADVPLAKGVKKRPAGRCIAQ